MHRHLRTALLTVALPLALGGCTTADAPTDAPLPAAFDQGVPEPSDDVVLTVSTDDASHDWDLGTLAALEQHDLTILEPFIDEEHTYTGPLWRDVLRASGVDVDAGREVELVALDDYVSELPTDAGTLRGVLLAHLEDGEEIPVADGGPIRLVFPDDNPARENVNNWIWSIRTARVI